MILYFGNILSNSGNNPSFIELLVPKLKTLFPIEAASDKENKVLRLLHMIIVFFQYRSKTKLILIDTYSYQGFYYAWVIGLLSSAFRKPYIPIIRGGDFITRISRSPRMVNSFTQKASCVVAPSQYMHDMLISKGVKVIYIPNFIELKDYVFKPYTAIKPELFWVRSFHKIYNPELAIEVVKILTPKYPNIHLTMAGPDKDGSLERCQTIVNNYSLGKHITFSGKLSKLKIRELAAQKSIFINTTTIDNHPVSVIEAMALGLAVVTTNVGGIPNLVKHDENGLLVNSGDAPEFAVCIESILNDIELAKRLQLKARAKVEEYDWTIVKRSWLALLNPYFAK